MDARDAPPPNTAAALHMQLFGPVRITADSHDITPKSRKARAIIAYLACSEARQHPRDRIAALLWSDRGEDQARASMRQAVAELRAGPLGARGVLLVSRDSLALAPGAVSTDVAAIHDAAAARAIPRLAALLADCRHDFLDDLAVAPAFDDWLQAERVRQHDRVVFSALAAVEATLGSASTMDINAILSALERLDPGNEHVVRIGLRADHLAGDTASMHRRYRRLTDQLSREFGIKPSEDSRTLFGELSAGGPPPVAGSRSPSIAPAGPRSPAIAPVAPPAMAPPVIMVSPLAAVDGNSETAALADMCTDDIRVALGQFRDLRVLALDTIDPAQLAATMSGTLAGYALSGKLRSAGDGIRINMQLANITTGLVIWTEQLRATPGALAEAVDAIVQRAAGAVMPAIERDLASVLTRAAPASDDMVMLYARARQRVRLARDHAEARAGADMLEAVIAGDPHQLGARLLLARLYNSDFWQTIAGHDSAGFRARAFELVQQAAASEPHNPRVQLRLAWCHLRRQAWPLAERGFEQALAQLQYDADAMNEVAMGFWSLGELDRAEATMQRAFRLNPFPPADYHADFAAILILRRQCQSAEEHFAVSGESSLFYRMLRLANASHLAEAGDLSHDLAAGVWRDFTAIWQRLEAPTSADIIHWLDQCTVLRRDADRDYINDGLRAVLSRSA